MENFQIAPLREQLKRLVGEGELLRAIEQAKLQLPENSDKRNIFIQFEREFKDLKMSQIQNLISFEQAQLHTSKLTSNLLSLIDILDEDDFAAPRAANMPPNKKAKAGSVLYAIPSVMEVQKEKQCVVRLAFDEEFLLDNFFAGHDTHIRDLRKIDSNMEVELVDPAEDHAFAIRTISSALQKVERDDYTEWLFFVKPLKQGKFPLYLKVSIITKEDGEKVRKELVLQEFIEVVAKAVEEPVGLEMRHSGFVFFLAMPAAGVGGDNSPDGGSATGSGASNLFKTLSSRLPQVAGALAILAGGLWVAQSGVLDGKSDKGLATIVQDTTFSPVNKLVIDPPFDNITVPGTSQLTNPARDTILHLPSGTSIEIPAGIFVDSQGRPVTTPVEIHFTEYQKPHEIITSGIPLKVRGRNGTDEWMQTAGMFDIQGFSIGKPVYIAQGKSLVVNLNSPVDGVYPYWKFEPEIGNWKKLGESTAKPAAGDLSAAERAALEQDVKRLRKLTANPVKKPLQNDGTQESLVNEVEQDELDRFPELRGRKDIVWLYAGDAARRPSTLPKDRWYPPELSAGPKAGQYWMTLKSEKNKYTLLVTPALTGPALAKEMALFEKAEQDYRNNLELLRQKESILNEQARFFRTMSLQSFGIYNYDILWKQPDAIPLIADFDFGNMPEAIKKMITVYMITGDDRVVVALPYSDWAYFRFSPSASNRLVAVLPGNKMAVFTPEDFKAELPHLREAAGKSYTFSMKVQDRPVESLPEVKISLMAAN